MRLATKGTQNIYVEKGGGFEYGPKIRQTYNSRGKPGDFKGMDVTFRVYLVSNNQVINLER